MELKDCPLHLCNPQEKWKQNEDETKIKGEISGIPYSFTYYSSSLFFARAKGRIGQYTQYYCPLVYLLLRCFSSRSSSRAQISSPSSSSRARTHTGGELCSRPSAFQAWTARSSSSSSSSSVAQRGRDFNLESALIHSGSADPSARAGGSHAHPRADTAGGGMEPATTGLRPTAYGTAPPHDDDDDFHPPGVTQI